MHGRHRLTDAELAEIGAGVSAVAVGAGCEGMYLTTEEEALFDQMEQVLLTPDGATRAYAGHRQRRQKLCLGLMDHPYCYGPTRNYSEKEHPR